MKCDMCNQDTEPENSEEGLLYGTLCASCYEKVCRKTAIMIATTPEIHLADLKLYASLTGVAYPFVFDVIRISAFWTALEEMEQADGRSDDQSNNEND